MLNVELKKSIQNSRTGARGPEAPGRKVLAQASRIRSGRFDLLHVLFRLSDGTQSLNVAFVPEYCSPYILEGEPQC